MPDTSSHAMTAPNPSEWVDRYGDMLFRIAITRVGDAEQAEDLVQETFLSGLRNVASFRGGAAFGTWLVSILNNKILDVHRRSSREIPFSDLQDTSDDHLFFRDDSDVYAGHWLRHRSPKEIQQFSSAADTADDVLEHAEMMKFILHCIHLLPQNMRHIFVLRTMDDMDTGTICKDLGVSESNVWTTLHRARTRVRQCVEQFYRHAS